MTLYLGLSIHKEKVSVTFYLAVLVYQDNNLQLHPIHQQDTFPKFHVLHQNVQYLQKLQ